MAFLQEFQALDGRYPNRFTKLYEDLGGHSGEISFHVAIKPNTYLYFSDKFYDDYLGQCGLKKADDCLYSITSFPCVDCYFHIPSDYPDSRPEFILSCIALPPEYLNILSYTIKNLPLDRDHIMKVVELIEKEIFECCSKFEGDKTIIDMESIFAFDDNNSRYNQYLDCILPERELDCIPTFDEVKIDCEICMMDYAGKECHIMDKCGHIFCRVCILNGFNEFMGSSAFDLKMKCLHCDSYFEDQDLKVVLNDADYTRYHERLLKLTLRGMEDMVNCPNTSCGQSVMLDQEKSLGRCISCGFVFCSLCYKAYHGEGLCENDDDAPIELNDKPPVEDILPVYDNCTNPKYKQLLGKIYGLDQIKVAKDEEKSKTELAKYKKCPNCGVNIDKTAGCNVMRCTACRVSFCWRCLMVFNGDGHAHANRCNA